jgi:hypothetical protein
MGASSLIASNLSMSRQLMFAPRHLSTRGIAFPKMPETPRRPSTAVASAAVLRASREASQLAAMDEKLAKGLSAFSSCGQGVEDAGGGDGPAADSCGAASTATVSAVEAGRHTSPARRD